jgi:hypothetical protein
MKVFIAALVRDFTLEPVAEIQRFNTVATRPYIEDKLGDGAQFPIRVSRSQDHL